MIMAEMRNEPMLTAPKTRVMRGSPIYSPSCVAMACAARPGTRM